MSILRNVPRLCCLIALSFVLYGCGSKHINNNPPPTFQLTLQMSGTGAGTITSSPAGISCGQTCSASFSAGTVVTLTATPDAKSTFTGWSGGCSGAGACTVTLGSNTSVSATFDTTAPTTAALTVQTAGSGAGTVTSAPAGITCPTACTANFPVGSSVTLSAAPSAGSTFAGWSGACTGTAACTVSISASTAVTATFNTTAPTTAALTVQTTGTGTGTVTSAPAGITCPGTCTANFPVGTSVTLTASPSTGSTFTGWSGPCTGTAACTVTVSAATSVTATFDTAAPPTAVLTVQTTGTGTGTVSSAPAGLSCPTTCSASFPIGTGITLTANPSAGSTFAGWTGASCTGTSTCTLTLNADTSVSAAFNPGATGGLSSLNHIVILAQENRSFDHYFGALRDYWAKNGYPDQSFDGLPQFNPATGPAPLNGPAPTNPGCAASSPPPGDCVFDKTNPVASFHVQTVCTENTSPSWNESHVIWDFGDQLGLYPATLDGFVYAAGHDARNDKFNDVNGIRAMGYYDGNDLNYYYFMASNFATSDRWFHPAMTRTNPNRQYLIAATSQGYAYPNGTNAQDSPLLTAKTIFEELQAAGISWKIYVNPKGSTCTGPPYDPACLVDLSPVKSFVFGAGIPTNYPQNIAPIAQYFTDVQAGTLPAVALIETATDAGYDEHPSTSDAVPNNIQQGANYVSTLINGLMQSPSWKDSAFILTYDEYGGLYDHVPPQPAVSPDGIKPVDLNSGDVCNNPANGNATGPICDFTYTGYRVPLIVVSPFTKKNYVSHTVADFTAILKLIETRFNVPALTKRDAAQPDMTEFFDFTNPPWMTPPSPPNQNTGGACYMDHLP